MNRSYFIGWDVGGWNCEKNRESRDAIVILDESRRIVGKPWRGNLRNQIVKAKTAEEWLAALFETCHAAYPKGAPATMAIDTPLGFPDEFIGLIAQRTYVEPDKTSGRNHYLFRRTERHLFEQGRTPLSAVLHQLGSQATKGIHAVAKFAPQVESCGVWTNGDGFRAIETYPAVCRATPVVKSLLDGYPPMVHTDLADSLTCALIAYLFATNRQALEAPNATIPPNEGWIWYPTADLEPERVSGG